MFDLEMLILAGGFGTRLKGVVSNVPKPMAPINGTPLLQLQLNHWVNQGQRSFIFLLHHKAEIIIEFLKKQSKYFGKTIKIDWIVEPAPLGTGGSVSNAICRRNLSNQILISNADTWLEGGLKEVNDSKTAAIATIRVENTARYGSISIDNKGFVDEFIEKNTNAIGNIPGTINAGLYKLPTSLFLEFGEKKFSLETEILPNLSRKKLLNSVLLNGNFFDIGVPEDYYRFCNWYRDKIEDSGQI